MDKEALDKAQSEKSGVNLKKLGKINLELEGW
jgi:hypothetical protein